MARAHRTRQRLPLAASLFILRNVGYPYHSGCPILRRCRVRAWVGPLATAEVGKNVTELVPPEATCEQGRTRDRSVAVAATSAQRRTLVTFVVTPTQFLLPLYKRASLCPRRTAQLKIVRSISGGSGSPSCSPNSFLCQSLVGPSPAQIQRSPRPDPHQQRSPSVSSFFFYGYLGGQNSCEAAAEMHRRLIRAQRKERVRRDDQGQQRDVNGKKVRRGLKLFSLLGTGMPKHLGTQDWNKNWMGIGLFPLGQISDGVGPKNKNEVSISAHNLVGLLSLKQNALEPLP